MLVYVVLQRDTAAAPCNKTVYGLLLPSANGNWEEVEVRLSMLEGGGWGLYPRNSPRLDWNDLKIPVLLPYLGLETVVQDAHMLKLLVRVLQGNFVLTQADEVSRANGDTPYVRDGLCAVPEGALLRKAGARAERLAGSTELLQVAHPSAANAFRRGVQTVDAGRAECCYLISEDAQRVLGLVGERAHLWQLLLQHGEHEHADRHLATHVAHVWRKEEGYVLINAHPAFSELISVTGMVNEPKAAQTPTMKMVQAYARLLDDSDPLLKERGLRQPAGAVAAWAEHTLPPVGHAGQEKPRPGAPHRLSERMVLYHATRRQYSVEAELTVDYGLSYQRNYSSASHKATPDLYPLPAEEVCPTHCGKACWPKLPGWHNPEMQPLKRPAFHKQPGREAILVCADDAALVFRRKAALGIDSSAPRDHERVDPTTITSMFAKRKRAT